MISTASSEPKPPTSAMSLPPPYSYEDLYSSYQNEWDQQRISGDTTKDLVDIGNPCSDVDINGSVSDLKWVTLPSSGGDKSDNTYLLACTDSGEVLVWKLAQFAESNINVSININQDADDASSDQAIAASTIGNTGPTVLLEPHARWKICHGHDMNAEADEDSVGKYGNERGSLALYGMCVVAVAANGGEGSPTDRGKRQGRKRQRRNDDKGDTDGSKQLLIVAGDGGLWSIPLLDALQQPWETSPSPPPPSLLRLSNRPIIKLQSSPSAQRECEEKKTQCLIALEKGTNMIMMWNLSTILEWHSKGNREAEGPAEKQIYLSRFFSGASTSTPSKSKSEERRKFRSCVANSCRERATTILIVPSITDGDGEGSDGGHGLCLLVGTDRSRLWILSIPNVDEKISVHDSKPRVFSLNDERKPSSQTKPQNSRQGGSWRAATAAIRTPAWKATDILETNSGTWWTVSATTEHQDTNANANTNTKTGLLITWHATTGMVVARQETREAIQAIRCKQQTLYSAANEGAVTIWDSSFRLARQGRFWASPPSSRALAISGDETFTSGDTNSIGISNQMMAVAGVGNKVDLFLDHCRVQTVRI